MEKGASPSDDGGLGADDTARCDQCGPYLHYVQRGIQAQSAGLVLVLLPKRNGRETLIFTLAGVVLFGLALTATTLLVLADARYADSAGADYQPGWVRWPVLSLLAPLAGGYVYLRRRERSID